MPKTDIIFFHQARDNAARGNDTGGPLTNALRLQGSKGSVPETYVVDEGSDADAIFQLGRLLKGLERQAVAPSTILVNIRDSLLRHAVETRLEAENVIPRPCIVSTESLVAANFIAAHSLFKLALWRGQQHVHVVIVGFGMLGRAFLDEILLDSIAAGLGKPMIDILATDAQTTEGILLHQMPEIGISATINVARLSLDDAGGSLTESLTQAEKAAPLTAIFVLLDHPSQTLVASATISEYQDRSGLALANLFIGGAGAPEAVALVTPKRPAKNMARQIKAIDAFASIPDVLAQICVGRDIVARRMHSAYQAAYGQHTAAGAPWEILSETYRRANRRAARNLAQKLWALGIFASDDIEDVHGVSPSTFDNVIVPLVQSPVESSVMRSLARLEHNRWCMDRRLDGWKYGERRDDLRRLHPSLIPFDDPRLSAEEIEKDISQLRFLLGSVVEPREGGAAVRFTIGILENAALAQPGIELPALMARVEAEAEREIIIICPVLTVVELAAATHLTRFLTEKNRRFHLFVPEWGISDQILRRSEVLANPDFGKLLALSETFVVPISSAVLPVDDGWEDLSAGDEKYEALKNYVLHRADALLATTQMPEE
eukprot:gene19369-19781_t